MQGLSRIYSKTFFFKTTAMNMQNQKITTWPMVTQTQQYSNTKFNN